MKKLFSLLMIAVMALGLSVATFAEDKPAGDKPAEGTKKAKKTKKTKTTTKTTEEKKATEEKK